MANNLNTNPMVFESAAAITSAFMTFHTITWTGASDSAQTCVVTDILGNTIVSWVTGTDYRTPRQLSFPKMYSCRGLKITGLDAGYVRLYS